MQPRSQPTSNESPRRDEGAVMLEFLIAFTPLFLLFLGMIQLGLLFSVRLVTHHAATNAARAAAVVIGDDPKWYEGEPAHELKPKGQHATTVRNAALLTLSPMILSNLVREVNVVFPDEERPGANQKDGTKTYSPMGQAEISKMRVRVEVKALCQVPLVNEVACPILRVPAWLQALGLRLPWPKVLSPFVTPSIWVRSEAVYPYQGASYEYED